MKQKLCRFSLLTWGAACPSFECTRKRADPREAQLERDFRQGQRTVADVLSGQFLPDPGQQGLKRGAFLAQFALEGAGTHFELLRDLIVPDPP